MSKHNVKRLKFMPYFSIKFCSKLIRPWETAISGHHNSFFSETEFFCDAFPRDSGSKFSKTFYTTSERACSNWLGTGGSPLKKNFKKKSYSRNDPLENPSFEVVTTWIEFNSNVTRDLVSLPPKNPVVDKVAFQPLLVKGVQIFTHDFIAGKNRFQNIGINRL